MKKTILTAIAFLILGHLLVAQTKEKIYYDKDWKGCNQFNAVFYRVAFFNNNGKPIGKVTDFFITGEIQSVIEGANYIDRNDDANSKFIGTIKAFYKSGKTHFEELRNMQGDLISQIRYYENGQKKYQESYKNELLEGWVITYDENGKVKHREEYKNGEPLGFSRMTIEKGCSYYGETGDANLYVKECKDLRVFKIIDDILSAFSLHQNFEIYEANIENAIATNYNNRRLIIIDPVFLSDIEAFTKDKYTSYLIIAHEIGHHLNAHIDNPSKSSPFWDELEADHFAGAALQKLGIQPITINHVINLIAPQFNTSDTHPEWQARMKAAINGYCQSAFVEIKKSIPINQKYDINKILIEEKKLELFLNSNIYTKADWERNIKYKVMNRKIFKDYEINLKDWNETPKFEKATDTIEIANLTNLYLRWHDPGEVGFDDHIETLQSKDAAKQLNPNWYFDNEFTITDDFNILLKLSTFLAKIQRLSELQK